MRASSLRPRNHPHGRLKARTLSRRPALEGLEDRRLLATFNVNSLADVLTPGTGVVTLRSAIQAANAAGGNNTINLTAPGTYRITTTGAETDNTAGEFSILGNGNLSLVNTSGGGVTVDGGGLNRVFDINPGATANAATVLFQGLTIADGSASPGDGADGTGGGIRVQGGTNVVLNRVTLTNNSATADGGGIGQEGATTGTLTVNDSTISNNHAGDAGGGIDTDGIGVVTINSGSVLSGNTTVNQGAAIWLDGGNAPLNLTGVLVANNSAFAGATGAIGNAGNGPVSINASIVRDNFSGTTGGGFGDENMLGDLTVTNSFFLDNVALTNGGGIQAGGPGTTTTISNTVIAGNNAGADGGGLFASGGTLTVSNSRIGQNVAVLGAGIEDQAPSLTVTGSTLDDNHAFATNGGTGGNGGGLDASTGAGTVAIANDLFLNNTANDATMANGGGINQTAGTLAINSSQFTGNAANVGGALSFAGTSLTVSGSTLNGNRSTNGGGALNFAGTGTGSTGSTLINDTFAVNATNDAGGAVLDAGSGDLALLDVTINGNAAATNGGGLAMSGAGILGIQDSIIALNNGGTGTDVFTGTALTVTDQGGNLIGNTSGSTGFGGGTLTGDPLLGPLQNNGGQFAGAGASSQVVQTEALRVGSPAFGKGIAAGAPATDERGFPLLAGGATTPSIGAYAPQFAANATPNQVFVESLYEVLLNRPADTAGAAFFAGLLDAGVGAPTVILSGIEGSPEYRDDVVRRLYQRFLDRAADPGGLNAFANFLGTGGTVEQVQQILTGSDEYFFLYGGTVGGFLQALSNTGLGRTIDPTSEAAFGQEIAGGMSRGAVAAQVFASPEYVTDLVMADYQSFLGRDADPAGLSVFVNALEQGITDQLAAAVLLGSQESIKNRS